MLTANIIATGLVLTGTQVQLGALASGLLASESTAQFYGSGLALPTTINMANLFAAGIGFNSTRVTEGFANAFLSKAQSPNSDTGTRIMIQYSGLPAGTQLVVPDLVAGSSALQPTAGGDLGTPQSPGAYASSANGSLLLARVNNPNADGSGGSPFYTLPSGGTAAMTLSTATQLTITNGSTFVVYEVVDSNPAVQESAQIPTFIATGAAPGTYGGQGVTFAPLSTVGIATITDPVPRFVSVTPPGDCTVLGDCTASYFPRLKLNASSVTLSSSAGGTPAVGYLPFMNVGGGVMAWNASISYQTGSGWLSINPTSGINNSTVNVHADPTNLAAGVYNATITIDAGPARGEPVGSSGLHGRSGSAADYAGVQRSQRKCHDISAQFICVGLWNLAIGQQCDGYLRRRSCHHDVHQCHPDQPAGARVAHGQDYGPDAGFGGWPEQLTDYRQCGECGSGGVHQRRSEPGWLGEFDGQAGRQG